MSYGEGVNGGIGGRQSVDVVHTFDQEMQKLGVLGITVLVSSGDSGVYDRIIFEDFDDIILEWRQYAQQNDPNGEWLERKAAHVFASSAMQFLPSSLRRQSTLDDLKREASARSSSLV